MAVELGLLALLVARPPRRLRGPFRRPILAAAVAGAALSVLVNAVPLPLQVVARQRANDVGLVTQSWPVVRVRPRPAPGPSAGCSPGSAARSRSASSAASPRRWWIPGSAAVVAFGSITIYAGPIVLDPIFNRFTPLPAGQTRSDVLDLAKQAGVDVGRSTSIDASRRTTAANAYVNGLGHTKRVVLYDNLLDDFSRDEMRLVVAHELGARPLRRPAAGADLASRSSRRSGCSRASRLTRASPREEGAAGPGGAARAGAERRRHRVPHHVDLQPALAARRGARRLLLAAAHRRAGAFISFERRIALKQRQRPRPAGTGRRSCSAPTRRRSTASAPAWRRGTRRADQLPPYRRAAARDILPGGTRCSASANATARVRSSVSRLRSPGPSPSAARSAARISWPPPALVPRMSASSSRLSSSPNAVTVRGVACTADVTARPRR